MLGHFHIRAKTEHTHFINKCLYSELKELKKIEEIIQVSKSGWIDHHLHSFVACVQCSPVISSCQDWELNPDRSEGQMLPTKVAQVHHLVGGQRL